MKRRRSEVRAPCGVVGVNLRPIAADGLHGPASSEVSDDAIPPAG